VTHPAAVRYGTPVSFRRAIVERDKRFVWHPYTPMGRYAAETEPLVIERAEGARLYDADGRSYLDGNSSWWTALLGHGHPRLLRALREQSEKLCHVALAGITHEPAARLAEELCALAPAGLSRVFYSDDGSTSVETALKLCLQYWAQNGRPERKRFVALDSAFHGETLSETALGGVSVFRRAFEGALLDCLHVPPGAHAYDEATSVIERLLASDGDQIAAVIVEPMVQGAGGMRVYAAEYLRRVAEVCRAQDVFLVADEVFTGYGRTGPMWACEHAAVSPDLLCLAKGFTAGVLPMAATLTSERIYEGFLGDDTRAFFHGHTYCGHALGAAVAREVLSIYADEHILERAAGKSALLKAGIERLATLPGVTGPRALGMVGAVDLGGSSNYLDRMGWAVYEEALRRGAYLRPLGNVVYLAPPLNIEDGELERLLGIAHESVQAVMSR
jgi:adenosylmethionine-8-amino-7-oxononanoate aminotransferase